MSTENEATGHNIIKPHLVAATNGSKASAEERSCSGLISAWKQDADGEREALADRFPDRAAEASPPSPAAAAALPSLELPVPAAAAAGGEGDDMAEAEAEDTVAPLPAMEGKAEADSIMPPPLTTPVRGVRGVRGRGGPRIRHTKASQGHRKPPAQTVDPATELPYTPQARERKESARAATQHEAEVHKANLVAGVKSAKKPGK